MQNRYEKLLAQAQEFLKLHAEILADAPVALVEETDEKKLHARLIKPSEELLKLNVAVRTEFSELTKLCIGVKRSVADLAVNRRKVLFAKKQEARETKEPEQKVEASTPSPKSKERVQKVPVTK